MSDKISKRLLEIIEALPYEDGFRILEIGCGPGVAARALARRMQRGYVLGIDRSAKAIQQALSGSQAEIRTRRLEFRQVAIEDLELPPDEERFDLAFAVRVGALDGRHPESEQAALNQIRKALKKSGRLFIDGGQPLREIECHLH